MEWHTAEIHLSDIPLVAELLMLIKNFFNDLLRAADIHHVARICPLSKVPFRKALSVRQFHPFINKRVCFSLCLLCRFSCVEEASCRNRKFRCIEAALSRSFTISID